MLKTVHVFVAAFLMFVFFPASVSLGQYIPNAPFKPQYSAAPDFTLKDMKGKIFRMRGLRGKPVLLFSGQPGVPDAALKCPTIKKFTKIILRAAWK